MADIALGLLIGLVLIFPLVELLRFVAAELIGVYGDMTLNEAFQGMIVILLTILIIRTFRAGKVQTQWGERTTVAPPRRTRTTQAPARPEEPAAPVRRSAPRRASNPDPEAETVPRRTSRTSRTSKRASGSRSSSRAAQGETPAPSPRKSSPRRRDWRAPD